jgi:hypothetical protein
MQFSRNVSTICASTIGAVTCTIGSLGNTSSPSGIARTSPVNRNVESSERNDSSNKSSEPRYSTAVVVEVEALQVVERGFQPAGDEIAAPGGRSRANRSKVAGWSRSVRG